jgi:hypothetical protein
MKGNPSWPPTHKKTNHRVLFGTLAILARLKQLTLRLGLCHGTFDYAHEFFPRQAGPTSRMRRFEEWQYTSISHLFTFFCFLFSSVSERESTENFDDVIIAARGMFVIPLGTI